MNLKKIAFVKQRAEGEKNMTRLTRNDLYNIVVIPQWEIKPFEPFKVGYACGVYGWNYNVYKVGKYCVVSGDRPQLNWKRVTGLKEYIEAFNLKTETDLANAIELTHFNNDAFKIETPECCEGLRCYIDAPANFVHRVKYDNANPHELIAFLENCQFNDPLRFEFIQRRIDRLKECLNA